jgi:hypothetical protein
MSRVLIKTVWQRSLPRLSPLRRNVDKVRRRHDFDVAVLTDLQQVLVAADQVFRTDAIEGVASR